MRTTAVLNKTNPKNSISEKDLDSRAIQATDNSGSRNVSETVESIDPEKAKLYLGNNIVPNRNLVARYVDRYANDMRNGDWLPIGDPIRFDDKGNLIDGQHRLAAIIKANVTLPFRVVRGLLPEDMRVIDTGKARTPADMLKIHNFGSPHIMAAAARILLVIKSGPLREQRFIRVFSHSQILDIAERHPMLFNSATKIKPIRGIRPSLLCATHYIGSALLGLPDTADAFIRVIETGIPSYIGDAAHAYRERLIKMRDEKMHQTELTSIKCIAHIWNKFARKEPVQIIKFPDTAVFEGLDTDLI